MCFFKKYFFKDDNKPVNLVGQLKLRSLDIDELFKRTPNFDEKETSVTDKKEEDKNIPAHWVGHSKLRSLDIYELFKRTPDFDEKAE